jgi:ubiquinone/menaquinone biosynthesis C-methylase UbiE
MTSPVAATFNAAADHYDDVPNSFFHRFGRRTVERLHLRRGARVLDVCCGSGASALPAAEAVGPDGYVLGVDLSAQLLELGRAQAARRGLGNVEFQHGDMTLIEQGGDGFDAVICAFGIFFVADMAKAMRSLWGHVPPGGILAITTWGPRVFEPAASATAEAVRSIRPDLYRAVSPWDRISTPEAVVRLYDDAGIANAAAVAEAGQHPIGSAEDWWTMVIGSGYRGTIDQLTPDEYDRVRSASIRFINDAKVASVEASVVYAQARKPAL